MHADRRRRVLPLEGHCGHLLLPARLRQLAAADEPDGHEARGEVQGLTFKHPHFSPSQQAWGQWSVLLSHLVGTDALTIISSSSDPEVRHSEPHRGERQDN